MSRPCIILTRPELASRALAAALAAEGWKPLIWPLLRIVPVAAEPDATGTQVVLLTSANAPRHCSAAQIGPLPPRTLCVGAATADAAVAAGYAGVETAGGDARAMLAAIKARLRPDQGPLLFLRGADVACDLGAVLADAGFRVRSAIVYRAEPASDVPPDIAAALDGGDVDAVAVFSPRSAATLAALLADRAESLGTVDAVAISDRAAAPLRALALRRLAVAATPDTPGMCAAIAALRGRGDVQLGPSAPRGLG